MKRRVLAFIFCLTFLGASSIVKAETEAQPAGDCLETSSVSSLKEAAELCAAQAPMDSFPGENMFKALDSVPGPSDTEASSSAMCGERNAAVNYAFPDEENTDACSSNESAPALAAYAPSADQLLGLTPEAGLTATASAEAEQLPDVPIVVNRNVQSFIKYFQTRGRKYFVKWLDRSQYYMSMLRSVLRENGLPEDLSYIAFIESGLNPTVKSRANAVGMWQFIRGTALKYGLRVDWWIDERMDPEKATYAAARYFKNLYGQFGSWYLAAASYNAGEGRVARAVRKHNSEDFWVLASRKKPLARETREYVPKYLAALLIAKDPASYGFDQPYMQDRLYDKVKVSQATDLQIIADASGTTVEEIKSLNPELLRWFTPPNYPDYEIKIPAGTAGRFAENMNKIPPTERISFQMHKVKKGETLAKIAKLYGTGVKPILYINNLKSAKHVKPGTTIAIPVRAENAKNGEVALLAKGYPQS